MLLALVVVVALGDGLGYGLVNRTGLATPWLILFPLAIAPLCGYLLVTRTRIGGQYLAEAALVAAVMWLCLFLQFLLRPGVNLMGFGQLVAFAILLVLVRAVFASAAPAVCRGFGAAAVITLYAVCGYVVLSTVVWRALGVDISVIGVLTPGPVKIDPAYGYRPSGLSREPAWAALALAACYIPVYYLALRHRLAGLLALALAAAALEAITLLPLLGVYALALVREARWTAKGRVGVAVVVALGALLTAVAAPRIQRVASGADSSTETRLGSFRAGVDVVARSPLLGVGYGNFRSSLGLDAASIDWKSTGAVGGPGALGLFHRRLGKGRYVAATFDGSTLKLVGVRPGERLRGTAVVRVRQAPLGSVTAVSLQWFDRRGRYLGAASSTEPMLSTWSRLTVTGRAPQRAASARVLLFQRSGRRPGTAESDWDRVTLERVPALGAGVAREEPILNERFVSDTDGWVLESDDQPWVRFGLYGRLAPSRPEYKSDSLLLNYTGELGVFGVFLVACAAMGLTVAGSRVLWLSVAYVVVFIVLSGTLLVPSLLLLAATAGALSGERHWLDWLSRGRSLVRRGAPS